MSITDGDHVYSVPRVANLPGQCDSDSDDSYYSDSESWLRGSERTVSSVDRKVNQRLNEGDSKEELKDSELVGIKKKPPVLPRSRKPVAAPRKNVTITSSHDDKRERNDTFDNRYNELSMASWPPFYKFLSGMSFRLLQGCLYLISVSPVGF